MNVIKSVIINFAPQYIKDIKEMNIIYAVGEKLIDSFENYFLNEYQNNLFVTINAKNKDCNDLNTQDEYKILTEKGLERLEKIFSIKNNANKSNYLRNYLLYLHYSTIHVYTQKFINDFLNEVCGKDNYEIIYDGTLLTYKIILKDVVYSLKDIVYDFIYPKLPANLLFSVEININLWRQIQKLFESKNWGYVKSKGYTWNDLRVMDLENLDYYTKWKDIKNTFWKDYNTYIWKVLGNR